MSKIYWIIVPLAVVRFRFEIDKTLKYQKVTGTLILYEFLILWVTCISVLSQGTSTRVRVDD